MMLLKAPTFLVTICLVAAAGICRVTTASEEETCSKSDKPRKKAFVHGPSNTGKAPQYFDQLTEALKWLDYDVSVEIEGISASNQEKYKKLMAEADLIWVKDHVKMPVVAEDHQKYNHILGIISTMTSKMYLPKMSKNYMPKTFSMPNEFDKWKEFMETDEGKNMKWVRKSKGHRYVNMVSNSVTLKELDKITKDRTDMILIQQFIDKPLLVDNHKIDVGIYVVVTSTIPTRAYYHLDRMVLRGCKNPYLPFNIDDRLSYVIEDTFTSPGELPSFKDGFEQGVNLRQLLLKHLNDNGYNSRKLFDRIDEMVRTVILQAKPHWFGKKMPQWRDPATSTKEGRSKSFELMRFDFIIEDLGEGNLKPWLMEVNYSPTLTSRHQEGSKKFFRNLIYDTLSLVGATTNHKPFIDPEAPFKSGEMLKQEISLHGCSHYCDSDQHNTTNLLACMVCNMDSKLPETFENILIDTVREERNRRHFKRIIPPEPTRGQPIDSYFKSIEKESGPGLTSADAALTLWIHMMCQNNPLWCRK